MNENEEETDLQVEEFVLREKEELEDGELAKTDELEIDDHKVEIVAEKFDKELSKDDIYKDLLKVEARLCGTEDLIIAESADDKRIYYLVSVFSGLLCGVIDSVFIGEWDFKKAKADANEDINRKVMDFAKKHGCKNSDDLASAIRFLEEKFPLPGDGAYQTDRAGLGITEKTHHLDDFCHHPTLIGLICSVIVQFTGETKYLNSSGEWKSIPITVNDYGNFVGNNLFTKILSGLVNWLKNIACTINNWQGHLMSDMAGSRSTAGGGSGLPGPIVSMLKELSGIPCFKDTNFGENLRKAFQNGIGDGKSQIDLGAFNVLFDGASSKMELRTELAVAKELKRQSIPVIINEALVRGFYFVKNFISELKKRKSVLDVNWENCIPTKKRIIIRMLTISKGVFTAFDAVDAAIRSGGINQAFILRVNFVGATSFVITAGKDVAMGIQRFIKEREYENQMNLKLVKMYQRNAGGFSSVFKNCPETKLASGPLFLHFDEQRYKKEDFRIMFVGMDNNLELSYLRVRKENDTILPLFEECKNFNIKNTKFGNFASNVAYALNEDSAEKHFVLWNSIFKFSKQGKKALVLAKNEEPDLLYYEIKICKPDAVVFMMGSKYDEIISKRLGGARFEEICRKKIVSLKPRKKTRLPNMNASSFAKVFCKEKGLPKHIYRVSNPKSPFFFFRKKSTYNWLVALLRESSEEEDDGNVTSGYSRFPKVLAVIVAIIVAIILLLLLLRNCDSKPRMEEIPFVYEQPLQIQEEIKEVPVEVGILSETRSAYFKGDRAEFESIEEADKWFDFMANEINLRLQKNPESRFVVMGHYAEFQNEIDGPALAKRRANIIAKGLIKRGVPQTALIVKGEEKPTKRWSQTDRRENRVATVYSEEE